MKEGEREKKREVEREGKRERGKERGGDTVKQKEGAVKKQRVLSCFSGLFCRIF